MKLEDLNWDHSFVRELPGDPRTDLFPREVSHYSFFFFLQLLCCLNLLIGVVREVWKEVVYIGKLWLLYG